MVHLSNKTMLNYAIMCFNEVLKRYPNSVEALENKAEALILDSKNDEAVEVFQKLIEVNPTNKAEYESKMGGEAPKAEPPTAEPEPMSPMDEVNELLKQDPKNVDAWNKKAELLQEEGNTDEAVECYLRLGHLTGEAAVYEKALELDPNNESAKAKLEELRPPEPVIEEPVAAEFESAPVIEEPVPEIEEPGPEPEVEFVAEPIIEEIAPEPMFGESATEEAEPIIIDEMASEPVTEEPEAEPTIIEEAMPEAEIVPEPEVIAEAEPVIEESVAPAEELTLEQMAEKGDELFGNEQYTDALEMFEKIVEQSPNDQDALHNKAAVLYKMERFDEAVATFDKLIELEPSDVTAYLTKGAALYWSGKYPEAIDALNNVVKRDSDDGAAWYYKACCESKKGNEALVIPFLKRAADLEPDFAERAKTDDAFDGVRDNPDFQAIVG